MIVCWALLRELPKLIVAGKEKERRKTWRQYLNGSMMKRTSKNSFK